MGADETLMAASAGARLTLIADSHERLTGRPLPKPLWSAPCVILAHGTELDPIFFYGNRLALELFETTADRHIRTPSRLSAEAGGQTERARLFDEIRRHGFVDDYAGVRVSATGRRFRIERATVWTLVDGAGHAHGHAAMFAHWTRLD